MHGSVRGWRCNSSGLLGHEVPTPALAPDEVLVEVHAASINPSDVKNVQGKIKQTTLPRTPGRDLAGIVVAGNKEMAGK